MDYPGLYLIHLPSAGMKLENTFRALNKLVRDGKIKYIGISNTNLKLLKESRNFSETPVITNQVPCSLSDRSNIKNGMVEYCQLNNIFPTACSPIDEGRLRSNKILETLAKTHDVITYQIALAWVFSQSLVITIPMSAKPKHIKENLGRQILN